MRTYTLLNEWMEKASPWLLFLPFLFFYGLVTIVLSSDVIEGDAARYLRYANNLLSGYYSPPYPDASIWNGPGYPILLAVFVGLNSPMILIKLFNALLIYLSLVVYFKTAEPFFPRKQVLFFTLLLALYYPIYRYLPQIYTECLTWFLFGLVSFLFLRNFKRDALDWKAILLASLALAYLALTKVLFGYVILAMVLVSAGVMVFRQWRTTATKSLAIFSGAMLFCLPYLMYTYSISGNVFYWSDAGGLSLYTMSSTYDGETGDWFDFDELNDNPNHHAFISSMEGLTYFQRDKRFKEKAKENILHNPKGYLTNIVYNTGRFLFFPSSGAPPGLMSYYSFPISIIVVPIIVLALGIAVYRFKLLPQALVILLLFVLIYVCGSLLVSTYRRMFFVSIPFWVLFVQYMYTRLITIRLRRTGVEEVVAVI